MHLKTVRVIDLTNKRCTYAPDLRIGRKSHGSACLGGHLFVFGGYGNDGFESSIEFLDVSSGQSTFFDKAW